jgi:oligopeptide/dipeptide ABC transporter ATP-binding protein
MTTESILSINSLVKHFRAGKSGLWSSGEKIVHALDDVSFDLAKGEMLALVGESGCGKSTLSLCLMLLERPTSGTINFEGEDVTQFKGKPLKTLRRHIQMVFQDPYESLNPLMTIGEIVAEPLLVHNLAKNLEERARRVKFAMESAGLRPPEIFLNRLPHELSGGQRQRVVIASALVLEPKVLLADEPVSMLDVSIRAEILNLLRDLRNEKGISIIFITHDLATVANICTRIAVMYLGRIVEIGPTLDVLKHPSHPYTKALMSVIPIPNPRSRKKRIILTGDPPDAVEIPSGCRFHPRCPSVFERCPLEDPMLKTVHGPHQVACWLPDLAREKVSKGVLE